MSADGEPRVVEVVRVETDDAEARGEGEASEVSIYPATHFHTQTHPRAALVRGFVRPCSHKTRSSTQMVRAKKFNTLLSTRVFTHNTA